MDLLNSDTEIRWNWQQQMEIMKKYQRCLKQGLHTRNKLQVSISYSFSIDYAYSLALHVALSSNYCCAVAMNHEGEVELRKMDYHVGNLIDLKEDQRKRIVPNC